MNGLRIVASVGLGVFAAGFVRTMVRARTARATLVYAVPTGLALGILWVIWN